MTYETSASLSEPFEAFDLDIRRNRLDVNQVPPHQTARQTLLELEERQDYESAAYILRAADEISKVVRIERVNEDGQAPSGLTDIFTANQVRDMQGRMHLYLGKDLDAYLQEIEAPLGYPLYVGRLATYFMRSDSIVTSQFGSFESRHTNPVQNATGPREANSRGYANEVNEALLGQIKNFYQADFEVTLVGPTKRVEHGCVDWERGIAECQFLVLDYIRDSLSASNTSPAPAEKHTVMTVEDIAHNIGTLLGDRRRIATRVSAINPFLADQVNSALDALARLTTETFHRGRLGVPLYQREPEKARRSIRHLETLLETALLYSQSTANQEDIPVLDL